MISTVSPGRPASATESCATSAGTGVSDRSPSRTTPAGTDTLSGSVTVQAQAAAGARSASARCVKIRCAACMPYLTSRLTICSISSAIVIVLEFSS